MRNNVKIWKSEIIWNLKVLLSAIFCPPVNNSRPPGTTSRPLCGSQIRSRTSKTKTRARPTIKTKTKTNTKSPLQIPQPAQQIFGLKKVAKAFEIWTMRVLTVSIFLRICLMQPRILNDVTFPLRSVQSDLRTLDTVNSMIHCLDCVKWIKWSIIFENRDRIVSLQNTHRGRPPPFEFEREVLVVTSITSR